MLQTYEGYYENGRFYPAGQPIMITGRKKVIMTVLKEAEADEGELTHDDETARRLAAIDVFLNGIAGCDEEVPEFERIKLREVEI